MSASCVTTAFLPAFRVKMSDHFAITGVDFAGPVHTRRRSLILVNLTLHYVRVPVPVQWTLSSVVISLPLDFKEL